MDKLNRINENASTTEFDVMHKLGENGFFFEQEPARNILEALREDRIKEVYVFVRYRIPFNLSEYYSNGTKYTILDTNKSYYIVLTEMDKLYNFFKNTLKMREVEIK